MATSLHVHTNKSPAAILTKHDKIFRLRMMYERTEMTRSGQRGRLLHLPTRSTMDTSLFKAQQSGRDRGNICLNFHLATVPASVRRGVHPMEVSLAGMQSLSEQKTKIIDCPFKSGHFQVSAVICSN